MKPLTKLTFPAACALAAIVAFALLTPRGAHALAATLVQVTNALSNPVISQEANATASNIITLMLPFNNGISGSTPTIFSQFTPTSGNTNTAYVVPAGKNLVITEIDITLYHGSSADVLFYPNSNIGFGEELFLNTGGITQQFRYASGYITPSGASPAIANITPTSDITANVHGYLTAN